MQSSILNSSTTAQVNVEIPLVDDSDAQMNLDVTLVDDTSAPMEVDAPETIHVNPSYNRLKKIASFVKSILFKKNIDQPLTVEDLKMHAPDMEFNDDEANSVLLLYQFFSPYLLPKVYDDDVDRHPLLNFPLVTVCNHILRSTGNEKFVRRSVPVVRHSKTYSITLDPTRLYLTLCSLKGRVGGTKGGNVQPLHSYGFDVFLPNGDTISNITKSIKFQD
ncbi:uncharacterized protein BX664DRAFT_320409, partial [Halteromyces radiatus]|uniref:uncharacterized protein n=1 Tax=Halteromyces radiatus TaxID=101107 RepID=UPI002220DACD